MHLFKVIFVAFTIADKKLKTIISKYVKDKKKKKVEITSSLQMYLLIKSGFLITPSDLGETGIMFKEATCFLG